MEHKSEKVMQIALANGWKAQVKTYLSVTGDIKETVWTLYCIRGKETIKVEWLGNRFNSSVYTFGPYRAYPLQMGYHWGVLRYIEGKPDLRRLNTKDVEELTQQRSLPFNDDAPALEILLSVLGKDVTWVRKIDGEIMKGTVEKETNLGKKYFRVSSTKAGRRFLEWQDRDGFHAVKLDQIVDVS